MTGPEHYRRAEHCIKQAAVASDERGDLADATIWISLGQVHAALAAAAAAALGTDEVRDLHAWQEVAGTKASGTP